MAYIFASNRLCSSGESFYIFHKISVHVHIHVHVILCITSRPSKRFATRDSRKKETEYNVRGVYSGYALRYYSVTAPAITKAQNVDLNLNQQRCDALRTTTME